MRIAQHLTLISSTLVSLPSLVNAITLDCKQIVVKSIEWDLHKLGGKYYVHQLKPTGVEERYKNTTFEIDICKSFSVPKSKSCNAGTRICASERFYDSLDHEKDPKPEEQWAVAGEFSIHGDGSPMNPKFKRLKDSDSTDDSAKEGLKVTIEGGVHDSREQMAHIDFICDRDVSGTERPNYSSFLRKRSLIRKAKDDGNKGDGGKDDGDGGEDGGNDEELPNPNEGASLQLISYNTLDDIDVLRLEWRTKYACEKRSADDDDDDEDSNTEKGGWGFFTWFIIIVFLAIAAYLIFGSWLNYNRYGARGWDLLPHGDTIRDIPYLLKDWGRRVFSTVSGGGSRDLGYIRV